MPIDDDQAAEVDRHRCTDRRDGRRCQLMRGHATGHAAATAARTRARRDDDRAWVETEDYPHLRLLDQLRWSPGCPRVED